ncbi:hypothetical protein [Citrobacter arsenatis]|uniref:hypothetical protein n=1 Tax=Citrobacter arsenatis TaxID=2546350 RepID=UPI00300DF214
MNAVILSGKRGQQIDARFIKHPPTWRERVMPAATFMVVENIALIQRPVKILSVITISYNNINFG